MYKAGGYEAHMTFDKQYAKIIESIAEQQGYVFSVISGCPLLGSGTYCYLTDYTKDKPEELRKKMEETERELDRCYVIPTLRSKIEHIVYDSKTGVNEL
jgi:hypothetical protein